MRIALLGTDPDAVALLAAALKSGHELVWLGEVRDTETGAIGRLAPQVPLSSEWELLLDRALADAVIVGRGTASNDQRAEQLKRLATDARAMLVVHPAGPSVLTYYEADMARRESGCVVRHYNPPAGHPAVADMARWVAEGQERIGRVVQVTCDRSTGDTSRGAVVGHFARDAEVLRAVVGGIRSTSAIGPREAEGSYASLQIQMASAGEASVRWAVSPAPGGQLGAKLTLVGERGSLAMWMPDDPESAGRWVLATDIGGDNQAQPLHPWNSAEAAIDELAEALVIAETEGPEAASTWNTATEAMEVADAAELSLQKGKSVDVHHQKLTQQLAFRGTMAAMGCGVLMLGFAVLVLMTLLGGVESVLGQPLIPLWPLALFGLLAVFLLLQAVPLLVTKRKK